MERPCIGIKWSNINCCLIVVFEKKRFRVFCIAKGHPQTGTFSKFFKYSPQINSRGCLSACRNHPANAKHRQVLSPPSWGLGQQLHVMTCHCPLPPHQSPAGTWHPPREITEGSSEPEHILLFTLWHQPNRAA